MAPHESLLLWRVYEILWHYNPYLCVGVGRVFLDKIKSYSDTNYLHNFEQIVSTA